MHEETATAGSSGCVPTASLDSVPDNEKQDLPQETLARPPGIQPFSKSSARRPTVPPRWGPATGDSSPPEASGPSGVNVWDAWPNSGHAAMFDDPAYQSFSNMSYGDYDYTSWSQRWHNSFQGWHAWPWASTGSAPRLPDGPPATAPGPGPEQEVQRRKMEDQQREKAIADTIEGDVLAGLKMLLEACSTNGGSSPSPELVVMLMEKAAVQGPIALVEVVEALFGAQSIKVALDIPTYTGMLRRLVLDPSCYRPAAVRLLLNVALSKESAAVPLAPGLLTDAETVIFERNVQEKEQNENPKNEEDKDDELEDIDEVGKEWPEEIIFRGCVCWPELNGVFKRTRDFDHVSQHHRPTYEKRLRAASAETRLLCFFWQYCGDGENAEDDAQDTGAASKKKRRRAAPVESGWWLGSQMGGKSLVGMCKDSCELPPGAGWQLKPVGHKSFEVDPGGFVDQERLGIEALQRLDLCSLQGHVVSPQGDHCARYFGHFCSLLHLEYLQEVATLRRRASRRSGEDLERGGWALTGLRVRDVFERQAKGKGKSAGKGKTAGFQLSLWLPPNTDIDRLRFRKGDSIILSTTHPLQDRFAEGQLQDLTEKWALLSFDSVEPPKDCKQHRWRVDKGSNRLSYARQLDSLVSLCTGFVDGARVSEDCSKIFEIINAGKVGQADYWASRVCNNQKGQNTNDATTAEITEQRPAMEAVNAEGSQGEQGEHTKKQASDLDVAAEFGLKPGDVVALHGLQSEALNNQQGEVVCVNGSIQHASGHMDESHEPRINVQLDGSIKAIRLSNVQKVDAPSKETHSQTSGVAALAAEEMVCDPGVMARCVDNMAAACTDSQQRAVAASCKRRLTVIQGPPGTGKTATAVQILRSWAMLGLKPLLAVADGNIAVDNIAAGLAKQGVDVKTLRVGRPEKVRPELEDITLDNQLRRMKQQKKEQQEAEERATAVSALEQMTLRDLKNKAADLNASIGCSSLEAKDELQKSGEASGGANMPAASVLDLVLESIRSAEAAKADAAVAASLEARTEAEVQHQERQKRVQMRREEAEMQLEALRGADVLCAQLITAGGGLLAKLGPFKGILIDEIAQATEIVSIVPIVQRRCERVVLAGDHCQLPPTVQSQEAERRGLTLSLYGRLVQEGLEPYFLDTQFRSHPKLVEWVAGAIYQGRLKSGIPATARPPIKGFDWPRKKVPVAFVEMGRSARETHENESKMNVFEAEKVVHIIESVLDAGCTAEELGVVTPYMAQVRLLRTSWRNRCKERGMKWNTSKNSRTLEIASVDNFQGREKELIVFSAVRNNAAGRVGFLADWRRLNVMLTRARRGLVVVGHGITLQKDPYWLQWLEWCKHHHVLVDKQAWHDIVRAAKRIASPHVKSLLHHLFEFEQAPQTEKAFHKFVKEHLGDRLEGPDDVEMIWQSVVQARQEAVAAAERRSTEEEVANMLTEVATAKLADIPKLTCKDVGDPDPSRRSRWRSWKFVAQEFLWAHPEGAWRWQELKEKMHAYYQVYLDTSSQTDGRSKKQLFREMRQSLPDEWFVKNESLQVQLTPLVQQQAARMVWKANRQDGVCGFQKRTLPWTATQAPSMAENDADMELGVQFSKSQESGTLSSPPKKRKRSASKGGAAAVLQGGLEPSEKVPVSDAKPDQPAKESQALSMTSSKDNVKRRKKAKHG